MEEQGGRRSPGRLPARAPSPAPGARLGPYRLLHRVGEGGMGVVHLALDPDDRAVAVKVLRPHIADDPAARERLRREVDVLRRVRHRRVAEVLDADPDGPQPYVVTQFVPARSLEQHVAEEGPLGPAALARLADGLGRALAAVHDAGVVHRDLKPSNVLMLDGDPVVIDFGIARVADDAALTSPDLVMGTAGYLPPELLEGADVGPAADWWGWAATTAFAATGRPPFGRGPVTAVLDRVRRGRADLDGVPAELMPVLSAALSPDVAERPGEGWLRRAVEDLAASAAREPRPVPSAGDAAATTALSSLAGGRVDEDMTSSLWSAAGQDHGSGRVDGMRDGGERADGPAADGLPDDEPLDDEPLDDEPPDDETDGVEVLGDGQAGTSTTSSLSRDEAPTSALAAPGAGQVRPAWREGDATSWDDDDLVLGRDAEGTQVVARDGGARPGAGAQAGARTSALPGTEQTTEVRGRGDDGRGYDEPGYDEPGYDERAYDGRGDDGRPGYERPGYERPGYERPGYDESRGGTDPWGPMPAIGTPAGPVPRYRPDRPGLRAAWAAALVATSALAPVVGLLVGALVVVVARTVERSSRWVERRREVLGPRRGDVPLALLRSPLPLLAAVVTGAFSLVLPLAAGTAVVLLAGVALGDAGVVPGDPVSLAAGAAAGVLVAWYGPGGRRLRRGTVIVTRAAPAGPVGRALVVVALLVLAAVVWLAVAGTVPDWWPLPGAPPGL